MKMTINRTPAKNTIENPAFAGYTWGDSSGGLSTPKVVAYGARDGGVLESGREHAALYAASIGTSVQEDLQEYHRVRTTAMSMKINGTWFTFFDDNPDRKKNLLLVHKNICKIPTNDPLVSLVRDRFETGLARRIEAPETDVVELSTEAVDGVSAFGSDPVIQGLLVDQAEPYVAASRSSGKRTLRRFASSASELDKRVREDEAIVIPVGLLGSSCDIGTVYTGSYSAEGWLGAAHARGVRGARDIAFEKTESGVYMPKHE
jgi:hypothetical protein